ncbi:MAG TPA: isochorismatase family protein [Vitreimonas sp.]|uniref:isochorismatase family protein n=1 Tax=Vitreimonas sp. TaxID=3069702 RepID=UPI002D762E4A|nr:isochorismatase family protein [Vitreimonas sp.]HYD86011.1 isochorismatase family protein [Vitreimonas sp.]
MLTAPLLVCLDVQRAFVEPGRFHAASGTRALMHGRRLLAYARERRWRIAHCLLRPFAAPVSMTVQSARPVHGFEPLTREMVFERESLSAYGHEEFDRLMASADAGAMVTGLSTSLSLLATSIDAFERGHRLILPGEALAGPSGIEAGAPAHEAVARDIARFLGFSVSAAETAPMQAHPALEAIVASKETRE